LLVIHVFWKVVGYNGVARVDNAYLSFLLITFVPKLKPRTHTKLGTNVVILQPMG
jgi:hypothetical protein